MSKAGLATRIYRDLFIRLKINALAVPIFLEENIWDRHREPANISNGKGKNIVITGGNKGLGLEAIKKMLPKGYHVIIGCRSPGPLERELQHLKKQGKFGDGTYQTVPIDFNSLESVRSFAKDIQTMDIPIHGLGNNAGKMFGPRETTKDGLESQMGVNYFGHVLLTHLLMPQLEAAGKPGACARIANTSSMAHIVSDFMDYDDLNFERFYHPMAGYGHSKAAQIMFTKYLDKKLQAEGSNVRVHSFHPGIVKTDLYSHNAGWITKMYGLLMKSPSQGGDTIVHALCSADLEGKGGTYMRHYKEKASNYVTSSEENQKKLWDATMKILKIKEFGKP